MKKLLLGIALTFFALFAIGQNVWINELHYDNAGTDVGEFVEVVIENPGNYALSDFAVYLYNGSNGEFYDDETIDNFLEGTTVGDYTIYTWATIIQNGAPDGLAVTYQGTVVVDQFLSYEGELTATDGPANGMTSTDIGVSESSSTPEGESLQLSGGGTGYADFTWQDPATETPGDENNNQSIGGTVTPTILNAFAISETAMDIEYTTDVTSVNAGDYSLTGTASITFSGAAIDGSSANVVHLTGASENMTGDITLDNIADAENSSDFDFYAGIMPVAFVNTTNPGGTMNDANVATFQGIISANDNYNNVWISDAEGAYNGVMIFSSSFDGLVAVGDEILFTANRTTYNSLSELVNPDLISTLSTSNSPYGPSVIDGSDIDETIAADTDPGEMWEGQLVTINNFTVDSYTDYYYRCSWSDGTTTYYFYVGDNVVYQLSGVSMTVGNTYASITGVVDWYNSGPYYRINPREQADIVDVTTDARIVGDFQGWNTTDPDYVMSLNANNLMELTKNVPAGDHGYQVIEGDTWDDEHYPDGNEVLNLSVAEDITWKANTDANLVIHTLPNVSGDFLSEIGGTDWASGDPLTEMEDPDGDEVYVLEVLIPEGDYECKVTLNKSWTQNTGGNIPFTADGVNATTFTYDFVNNVTTVSGPPPTYVTITFTVVDTLGKNYNGFNLKGSWTSEGFYDPGWGGGTEHSIFYDDGMNGDTVAGDHIWACQQELVVDGGSNTWEWGVNDTDNNWIAGNWQFTIPDDTPQYLSWDVPDEPALIVNEIMYNSPGEDQEWIELYNNTGATIDLENWKVLDDNGTHTPIVIPAGHSVADGEYFTIAVAGDDPFPFTPDYDGRGNFQLNNGGDDVRLYNSDGILIDIVSYDDSDPWPTEPDGDGPSLSLIDPETDNSLPQNWQASLEVGGTPGEENFPPIPFITVNTPNGGESIQQGEDFEITWTYGFWDGPIQIDLVKGDDELTLVFNIPVSDNSYTWGVFDNQEIGDDYIIRISGINSGDPTDDSDDYFSIIEAYVMPQIVISEIMYNPPESGNDSLEFLEFYNKGDEAVDFEGFFMSQGVEHIFPSVVLEPDTFLLLSIDSLAFFATFGIESLQWTDGALSNGGEPVELSDQFGNVINTVPYDDQLPWDTLADGFGPSLELLNPELDNSLAESWMHSINFIAVNGANDSIWATPGFGFTELSSAFEADTTLVLVGDSVMFTDLSTGTPTSWMWTFEGGTPATYDGEMPPYIAYGESGRWDVTLVVSDGVDTDSLTYEEYIWSGVMPVSDFEAEETEVIVGSYTNFISMATGDSLTYQWTFEGGTPETSSDENPMEIYYNINEWEFYDVTLIVSNGFGSDTLIKEDYIEVTPVGVSDDIFDEQSISLYPNPTSGKIVLAVPVNIRADYKILDINGRIVYSGNVAGTSNIDLGRLGNGIYFMKLIDTKTQRVVVKRILIK